LGVELLRIAWKEIPRKRTAFRQETPGLARTALTNDRTSPGSRGEGRLQAARIVAHRNDAVKPSSPAGHLSPVHQPDWSAEMKKNKPFVRIKTPTRKPLTFAPKSVRVPKGLPSINVMPVNEGRAVDDSAAANIRTMTCTVDASALVDPRRQPGEMIRPDAEKLLQRFANAAANAEHQHREVVRTIRYNVKGAASIIKKIAAHHGVTLVKAAAIFGAAIERLAADASVYFAAAHEHAGAAFESQADRSRDVFMLIEVPAMGSGEQALAAIDTVLPLVSGHPHVFIGVTMSAPGQPALLAAIRAAAELVARLGTDAGRVGLNFLPEPDGPYFPGTTPTVPGALTAGGANANLLTDAVVEARRRGADAAGIAAALEDEHAAFLQRMGRVGLAIADACGFNWQGVSPITAPVNATLDGLPPERWSAWKTLEALQGEVVHSGNVVPAVARFNACLWRAAIRSRELLRGPRGFFAAVAEDGLLAHRVRNGQIDLSDLVVQQTACAVGLDMLVLDPSTSAQQVGDLLSTVATMSAQLSKPLTARLIIPPRNSTRMANGDVLLGSLLGAAPTIKLPGARDAADLDARVDTLAGAMRESSTAQNVVAQ
jgi:uncharacterized protein (UPF0210 family)